YHYRGGAALETGSDEIMAVVVGSPQCDEQIARGESASVDRYARRDPVRDARSASRAHGICGGPKRCHRKTHLVKDREPDRTISRATAASSKGCVSPRII